MDQPVALVGRSPGRAAPVLPGEDSGLLVRRADNDSRRRVIIGACATDVFEPGFVFAFELGDDLGMLRRDVLRFVGIAGEVEQLELWATGRQCFGAEARGT